MFSLIKPNHTNETKSKSSQFYKRAIGRGTVSYRAPSLEKNRWYSFQIAQYKRRGLRVNNIYIKIPAIFQTLFQYLTISLDGTPVKRIMLNSYPEVTFENVRVFAAFPGRNPAQAKLANFTYENLS